MKIVRNLVIVCLLGVGVVLPAPELGAQEWECGWCSLGPQGQHAFDDGGEDTNATCESWKTACRDQCHQEPVDGHCFSTHYEYCDDPGLDEELLLALQRGDGQEIRNAVMAAHRKNLEAIKVAKVRNALQVTDCSGLVVAQVPRGPMPGTL